MFIGNKLPQYGASAIKLAEKYSGMKLNFIGNKSLWQNLKGLPVDFIAIEDFYNPSEFKKLEGRFERSPEFRNGFWLKTLERFFVIEQFIKFFNVPDFFHAELDQLLFRTDELKSEIRKLKRSGLFLPFHTESEACASVFYCNDYLTIRDFIEFTNNTHSISSEMLLLSSWAKITSKNVYVLPSISSENQFDLFNKIIPGNLMRRVDIDGLVDPLELGPWVGGNDPRNEVLAIHPQTRFSEVGNPYVLDYLQLKKLKFNYDSDLGYLQISSGDITNSNIYNLHFHSKLHNWLMKDKEPINRLLMLANSEKPIKLRDSRIRQIRYRLVYFFSETLLSLKSNPKKILQVPSKLIKNSMYFVKIILVSINIRFNRHPSSAPFLSGDTFRAIADKTYEKGYSTFNASQVETNDVIFCQSDLIMNFNEEILAKLNHEIILLLGNSDQNFTSALASKLNLNHVNRIFAQNLVEEIEKFVPLPIGLENAWRLDNGKPLTFRVQRLLKLKKTFKVMWTFSPTNLSERALASEELSRLKIAVKLPRISKLKHRFALSKYAFVASPPGNGLDCHRTWEAMYLRCIPVVKRSYMAEEFEKRGLPIWIVDSYDELADYDVKSLKVKYQELAPKFKSELLWFNYWKELIQASKVASPKSH